MLGHDCRVVENAVGCVDAPHVDIPVAFVPDVLIHTAESKPEFASVDTAIQVCKTSGLKQLGSRDAAGAIGVGCAVGEFFDPRNP